MIYKQEQHRKQWKISSYTVLDELYVFYFTHDI